MAHFAQLDSSNMVIQVIVVGNPDCLDENGNESETVGVAFCKSLFGADTQWRQTSYSGSIRKNYAGIGCTYDAARDAFIPPKPFASWVLNESTCQWETPIPKPDDGNSYVWNEETGAWEEIEPLAPERARNADGTFVADNPATPTVNEAWATP